MKTLVFWSFSLCFLIFAVSSCKDPSETSIVDHEKEDIWYLNVYDEGKTTVDLFVKEMGVGDTIVVVHGGFGAEHGYLLDLLRPLHSKFHFVYYDQRGSLRSPAKDSLITANAHIEDLEQLRQELKVEKLNLLGHSMGTWISSAYLEAYPNHVNRMTLLALVWPKPDMNEEEAELSGLGEEEFEVFLKREEIQETIKQEGFDKEFLTDREKSYRWQIKFASASIYDISKWRDMKGGWAFFNQNASTAAGSTMPQSYNWIDVYKENPSVGITVINGSHDFVDFGARLHKKWLVPLPNVSYHLIENAGHNSWVDEPERVRELILKSFE